MNGMCVTERHCVICGKVEFPPFPGAGIDICGGEIINTVCPDCKRAVMYAREMLKEKERGRAHENVNCNPDT